jgi:hypothetical protein
MGNGESARYGFRGGAAHANAMSAAKAVKMASIRCSMQILLGLLILLLSLIRQMSERKRKSTVATKEPAKARKTKAAQAAPEVRESRAQGGVISLLICQNIAFFWALGRIALDSLVCLPTAKRRRSQLW